MPIAKKLPSGSWRCQVYDHSEWILQPDGTKKEKKIKKSFTCKDPTPKGKRTCEAAAAKWAAEKNRTVMVESHKTFDQCLEEYVDDRASVLSATTLREYRRLVKRGTPGIGSVRIDKITPKMVQKAINDYAVTTTKNGKPPAPKTVKNLHGCMSVVLKNYRPDITLNTKLPQKEKRQIYIPTDEEIKKLREAVKGTNMELPVLLACIAGLRRGEICGLRKENIHGNSIWICENKIRGEEGFVVKSPKSVAGYRVIDDLPDFLCELWKDKEDYIVDNLTPTAITDAFPKILKRNGMKHFRFHDLRHYCVSTLHKLGVPDSVIIYRTGHSSVAILEAVYLHATQDKIREMNTVSSQFFTDLFS